MVLLAGRSRGWRVGHSLHFALQEPGDREAGGGARAPKAAAKRLPLRRRRLHAVAAPPALPSRLVHRPVLQPPFANGAEEFCEHAVRIGAKGQRFPSPLTPPSRGQAFANRGGCASNAPSPKRGPGGSKALIYRTGEDSTRAAALRLALLFWSQNSSGSPFAKSSVRFGRMTDAGSTRLFRNKRLKSRLGGGEVHSRLWARFTRNLLRCRPRTSYLGRCPLEMRAKDPRDDVARHPPPTRRECSNVFVAMCGRNVPWVH
jgi:hypothetical protein